MCAEDAAVKIQAVFRGHKVRTDMKQGDGTDTTDGTMTTTKNGGTAAAGSAAGSSSTATAASNNSAPSKQELEAEFREDDKGEQARVSAIRVPDTCVECVYVCVCALCVICYVYVVQQTETIDLQYYIIMT